MSGESAAIHAKLGRRIGFTLLAGLFWLVHATQGTAQSSPSGSPDDLKALSLEELLGLQVSSVARRLTALSDAPSAIQVITGDDIRRAGVTTLAEALRLASNLQVARIDSRQWAISARGFNGTTANKLLVLIDGRTVYTPLYSGVFWDVQDAFLADVDRIEVISGPGASLWGSNAVNGVINVITKSAADTHGLYVSAAGGNELTHDGALRLGGGIGSSLHLRAYAKSFGIGHSDLSSGGPGEDDWHFGQGGFRADWASSDDTRLTVQGDIYDGTLKQATAGDISVSGHNLRSVWSRVLSEGSDVRVQLYYDHTNRDIPALFGERLSTYDVDVQHGFFMGERQRVVWGFGYRLIDDDVDNSATFAFLPSAVRRDWLTAFVQDELSLVSDRVRLTLGSKFEHNDYTGVEVQPNVRLQWASGENSSVWAAASRAARVPSRIDRELFSPAEAPYVLVGNPDFVSETVLAYETGYRLRVRESVVLSVAGFVNDYDHLRSIEGVDPPAPIPATLRNDVEGTSWGAELTADVLLREGWLLRIGHTELRTRLHAKNGSEVTAQDTVTTDPDRQFFLRSSVDLGPEVTADASFRWIGPIASQRVPGYRELDARLAWRPIDGLELSAIGRSLLHTRHAEFGAISSRHELRRAVHLMVTWRR